ncbi:MAG: L-seryl-tRNA(Sec) selenium transferase [Synergistales bacterium]|nr:L-seryl-tRNA(Sec) selenium transferase [Synergistales bacterium]
MHTTGGRTVDEELREKLRRIPSMDRLLEAPWIAEVEPCLGKRTVKGVFADIVGELRRDIRKGEDRTVDAGAIVEEARRRCRRRLQRSLRRVVNATGVVVHTNLGRSCLCGEAVEAVTQVASSYNTLEYNLEEGTRGQRNDHVEWLLCEVTGADAAMVVNNNAGAVLLALAALAAEREVVVSRGELVEIGGSFRIPDIMTFSGAVMREVGTTNRTHPADYLGAIGDQTAMLLKVHPSNFRVQGFTREVTREELAAMARERELICMEDLGSGMLLDFSPYGLSREPSVRDCLQAGVDLVTFSGDKLLGGPQIGGIVGRRQLIDRLRSYPLARALRVDKMTLAAMESTLRCYLAGREGEIPTVGMLALGRETLHARAEALSESLEKALPDAGTEVVEVDDAVGGGAFPQEALPGVAVALKPERMPTGRLQEALRGNDPPIVCGAREDTLLIHVRTLLEGDEGAVVDALAALLGEVSP